MDLAKNGVIVRVAETGDDALKLLNANPFWCTHCKNFRIVIVEEDMRFEVISIACTKWLIILTSLVL